MLRRFADLPVRFLSAVAMVAAGVGFIWVGGHVFNVAICLLVILLVQELTVLCSGKDIARWHAWGVAAAIGAVCATMAWGLAGTDYQRLLVVAVPLACSATLSRGRTKFAIFGIAALLAAWAFADLRAQAGVVVAYWFVCAVAATDIAGYFGGKLLRGPLVAPAISKGKRWSGTASGWVCAALTGAIFSEYIGSWVVWFSILVAVFSQIGDLAESWLKRQSNMDDSSAAIPGHGGVFDRFDGYVGAGTMLWLVQALNLLPAVQ